MLDLHRAFPRPTARLVTALALAVFAFVGCSDDDDDNPSGPGSGSEVAGTWSAASFTIAGSDAIAAGMSLTITFTVNTLRDANGTYSIIVTNDQADICDGGGTGSDCNPTGLVEIHDGFITFDPDEEDPTSFAYTVEGGVLTMSTVIEGDPVIVTLNDVTEG